MGAPTPAPFLASHLTRAADGPAPQWTPQMQSPTADAARARGQQETAGHSGDSGDRKHTSLITSAAACVQQRDTHSSPSRKTHFCPMQPVLSSSPHPAVLPGTLTLECALQLSLRWPRTPSSVPPAQATDPVLCVAFMFQERRSGATLRSVSEESLSCGLRNHVHFPLQRLDMVLGKIFIRSERGKSLECIAIFQG